MKQHIALVGNAPRPRVQAEGMVCTAYGCNAAPSEELEAPLCMSHAKKIAVQVMLLNNTSVDKDSPYVAGKVNRKRLIDPYVGKKTERYGLVYFIQFGDRIKIGYTTDLEQRMSAIPHDKILALIAGTMADERRCHEKFAHLRLTGEWFSAGPDLLKFIAKLPVHETLAA